MLVGLALYTLRTEATSDALVAIDLNLNVEHMHNFQALMTVIYASLDLTWISSLLSPFQLQYSCISTLLWSSGGRSPSRIRSYSRLPAEASYYCSILNFVAILLSADMSYPPTEVDPDRGTLDRLYSRLPAANAQPSTSHIPSGKDVPGTSEEASVSRDILRLIPLNPEAKRAFDSVVRLEKAGDLSANHAQFLQVTSTHPFKHAPNRASRNSDETTDEFSTDDQGVINQRVTYEGHFRVRFRLPLVSRGWRLVCVSVNSCWLQYARVVCFHTSSPSCRHSSCNP